MGGDCILSSTVEMFVGPHNTAFHEPIMLRIHVRGEEVSKVDVVFGYSHRGIEKLVESNTFIKSLYIISRVCGMCNVVHTTCYVQAVEKIEGVEVPERALALRTLALELERMHSHMISLAITAEIVGLENIFASMIRDRERVMHMRELLTGNRIISDYVWPGGVRRDVDDITREKMLKLLEYLEQRIREYRRVYEENPLLRKRLEGVGKLRPSEALDLGLLGPVARASGVAIDVRRDEPYAWYDRVEFNVVVRSEGDSLARILVRLDELLESINIARQVLQKLPNGPINSLRAPLRRVRAGEAISRTEAPRGELVYHVVSRGGMRPYRVRIRTPSLPNILNTTQIYRGLTLADVPVVLASLDPCISCIDRVIVVDERSGETRFSTLKRLAMKRR